MFVNPALLNSSTWEDVMPVLKNHDDWKNRIWMDLQCVLEPILMRFLRRSAKYGVPDEDCVR